MKPKNASQIALFSSSKKPYSNRQMLYSSDIGSLGYRYTENYSLLEIIHDIIFDYPSAYIEDLILSFLRYVYNFRLPFSIWFYC